ncbi:6592_t:CDS:2 [Scutellospora calospora]|uniref:6592_t:CDS:1 n=1 Tax=Scutellospora calospora TaxID=85575 RepID=A0ACA9JU72_9GLOM|nr:6592_t:CDS:2 [Scutellospora calospora]
MPVPGSCNFYTDCLEKKFHCGNNGYPLSDGLKYCEKFTENMHLFSSSGKDWVTKTKLCLQESLVQIYENDSSTCSEIKQNALDSHADCYVTSGICIIPPSDWVSLLKTIDFKDLFGSLFPYTFKQALETAVDCEEFYIFLEESHKRQHHEL